MTTVSDATTRTGDHTPSDHYERILNLVPSTHTDTDWDLTNALESGELTLASAIPRSVDLRAAWWTVGNQESTGSCVGWATADGVMRYTLVKSGLIELEERLSPRFVWMGSKETDEFTTRPETFIEESGTSLKAAVDVCRTYGIVTEEALPFHISTAMYLGKEATFYATAAQRRIRYYNLRRDVEAWRHWLADGGPILAGFSVDHSWDTVGSDGMVGPFQPGTVRGGHAITIVGYRTDGRFIVRNSWGTAWGDQGFAYVTAEYVAAGFFGESYGVQL